MQITYLNIEDIKPYKNNPRKNKEAIDYVVNSIKEFGFKVPITIDENNVIITGHTRYEASKRLGLKQVPCIIVKDLNEEQIRAYRLADNKVAEMTTWDFQKLEEEISDIKRDIISDMFRKDLSPVSQASQIPPVPTTPKSSKFKISFNNLINSYKKEKKQPKDKEKDKEKEKEKDKDNKKKAKSTKSAKSN